MMLLKDKVILWVLTVTLLTLLIILGVNAADWFVDVYSRQR